MVKVCGKKLFWAQNLQKRDFRAKNVEKMAKYKNFGRKFFLVGIEYVLNRILKRKSQNRFFFDYNIFPWD